MKRQFTIGALVMALLSFTALARAQTTLIAQLTGAQETPPTTSAGSGLGIFTLDPTNTQLSYDVIVTGLAGVVAAHIHPGAVGVAGPVLFPLATGPFTHLSGTITVTPDQAATLLAGGMYINVHTAANPGGEIRGQIVPPAAGTYLARLVGSAETPPTNSTGTGLALLTLDPAQQNITYSLFIDGLTNVTAAHIHMAPSGVSGPIIIPIASGPFTVQTGTSPITPDEVTALNLGDLYVNVHTAANPAGEIRGQIFTANSQSAGTTAGTTTAGTTTAGTTTTTAGTTTAGTTTTTAGTTTAGTTTAGTTTTTAGTTTTGTTTAGTTTAGTTTAGTTTAGTTTAGTTTTTAGTTTAGTTTTGTTTSGTTTVGTPGTDTDWQVNFAVNAVNQGAEVNTNTTVTVGTATGASDGWAPGEDIQGPGRPPFNFAAVVLVHSGAEPGWENHGGLYTQDIRAPVPAGGSKQFNNLTVISDLGDTGTPATVVLSWGNLTTVSPDLKFTLVLPDSLAMNGPATVDMRAQSNFTFQNQATPDDPVVNTPFTVIVTNTSAPVNPVITNLTVNNIGAHGAMITYVTDVPSDTMVRFGTSADNLSQTISDPALTTQHTVTLSNLAANTVYFFQATSTAPGSQPGTSSVQSFSTLAGINAVGQITISALTPTSASISFQTDVPATAQVQFGTDPNSLIQTLNLTTPTTAQVAQLSGLQPNTQYFVKIVSSATGAEDLTQIFQFTTTPSSTIPGTGVQISDVTQTGATVTFGTQIPTTAQVFVGTSPDNGTLVADLATANTQQTATLTGLQPNLTYFVKVVSSAPGFQDLVQVVSFTTGTAPSITFLTGPTATTNLTSAIISFSTDVPTTGEIHYGPTPGLGNTTTFNTLAPAHSVRLSGLQGNATYYYEVVVLSPGRNGVTSPMAQFTTSQPLEPVVFTTGPSVTSDTSSAVISFSTDVPTTGEILYGPTSALGSTVMFTTAAASHNVRVPGLQPNSGYFYQVLVNAPGRTSTSSAIAGFSTTTPIPSILKGDANGDGKVDIADVTQVLFFVIGKQAATPTQIQQSDVAPAGFPDGVLDLRDVTHLLRFVEGLDPSL